MWASIWLCMVKAEHQPRARSGSEHGQVGTGQKTLVSTLVSTCIGCCPRAFPFALVFTSHWGSGWGPG